MPIKITPGQQFGLWTALKPAGVSKNLRQWLVRCACGKEKVLAVSNLHLGRSRSCGCQKGLRHGMYGTTTYTAWQNMMRRCTGKHLASYPDYGGRGITYVRRWASFKNFLADMGEAPKGHTLDRWDNDKGYSPGNCFWATRSTNNRHKRNTLWVTWEGQKVSMAVAAELSGISYWTLVARFRRQGDVPDIFRKAGERYGNQYGRIPKP